VAPRPWSRMAPSAKPNSPPMGPPRAQPRPPQSHFSQPGIRLISLLLADYRDKSQSELIGDLTASQVNIDLPAENHQEATIHGFPLASFVSSMDF
jgi:hypothetical protein